jgi:uncharacterized protein (DUF362 family)
MDRREFIKKSITLGIALSAASKLPGLDLVKILRAEVKPEPIVSAGEGTNYKNLVIDVIDKLGGMKKFVSTGDTVVVKPNIAWDSTPELGANTHPIVAKTVVELCLDAGAKKVKVFDRTANEPRRSYKSSGIQDAVEEIKDNRVDMKFVETHKFIELDIKRGVSLKRWSFYKEALDADKFINIPVAKHHSLAKLTIGMKNIMGVIGGNRGDIHRGIDQNLVDINTVVKSDLTIVDATRIMFKHGPTGGSLDDIKIKNKVIASPDIVAVDSYTATLFGLTGGDLGFVNIAHDTGLGEKNIDKMKII